MARRFAKVSEEEIEEAFFYPSDLVNTKTTIPLRVGEERWIYTSTLRVSVYIHHYSPPLRGIVVYYVDNISWMDSLCPSTTSICSVVVSRNSPYCLQDGRRLFVTAHRIQILRWKSDEWVVSMHELTSVLSNFSRTNIE